MADGKPVALVVGAGDAIGSAIARSFADEGYVICAGRRNGDRLASLVEEIEAGGGEAHGFTLDARKEEAIEELFKHIEDDIGPLEVVVFNVGANVNFPITETTSRVFYKVWEMACFGGFLTGREAAKYMSPREKGTILFTGATASMRGGIGYAAFAAAKHGLKALAQAMARELGPKNIHVAHLVIDSAVDTPWIRERFGERFDALKENDGVMNPESIGKAYVSIHNQPRDAWTFEMDLRPYSEKW